MNEGNGISLHSECHRIEYGEWIFDHLKAKFYARHPNKPGSYFLLSLSLSFTPNFPCCLLLLFCPPTDHENVVMAEEKKRRKKKREEGHCVLSVASYNEHNHASEDTVHIYLRREKRPNSSQSH